MSECFAEQFRNLTGHAEPLSWQTRLFDRFKAGLLPSTIDLPTGLGKTMVMAIWLIAREKNPELPRRLVYVVDRRTVVDQATDIAIKLRDKAKSILNIDIAISTLRGQLADNREWSADPTRPAIIIGTVDLIGSALLFSGYRSSYKRRPLEAGLLGQNSLLVLDEAHLSRPFDKLLESIEQFNRRGTGVPKVEPLKVIRMSATTSNGNGEKFTLDEQDLQHPVINERFAATKTLSITTLGEKDKLNDKLADAAVQLATGEDVRGKRIVVFVRSPDSARAIAERIRSHASTKTKPRPFADSVEVLTGTMRGLERDELVEKPVMKRFLDGEEKPGDKDTDPVFLISTSAGEVGFDLNADHMVCDATTIDSLIQRLGRVNRRGKGNAKVVLVLPNQPADKTEFDKACIEATKLLTDGMSLSPEAIAALKRSLTSEQLKAASTPEPATVELTDILLDNWSMTSIVTPMPGRPPVDPWLRGIADWEPPRTEVAWRAELDLPGFDQLDLETIEEWFDTHRILTHETLSDRSDRVAATLVARWTKLEQSLPPAELDRLRNATVVIDRAGIRVMTVEALLNLLRDRNGKAVDDAIRNAEMILPASFGGIERGVGLLDSSAPKLPEDQEDVDNSRQRLLAPDVADIAPGRQRLRELVAKTEDDDTETEPIGGGKKPPKPLAFRVILETDDDRTVKLVSYVPRREKPELGSGEPESLASHVGKVRRAVDAMLGRLSVPDDIRRAAQLAADWHDHGKDREHWQRTLIFPKHFKHPGKPIAKSGGEMKRDPRGYRHEFGSLREFIDAFNAGQLLDHSGTPIRKEVYDLAMHLIAAHHGRGRPHFPKGGFDPDAEERSDEIHTEVIQRFARLQRKHGWWGLAWLENLLRCADQLASAETGSGGGEDEMEGGDE